MKDRITIEGQGGAFSAYIALVALISIAVVAPRVLFFAISDAVRLDNPRGIRYHARLSDG